MTSFGPVTGKAAIGTPLASASSCTTPNVSVRLGNTNTSAAARCAARMPLSNWPRNFAAGKAPLELPLLRSGADDDFAAGQIEREERRQVLFDGDPAHGHEDRPRKIEIDGAIRPEQIDVDAARPHAEIAKAALGKLGHQRWRRHHRHRGGGMKAPQRVVDPLLRDRRARRDIFGKARRVARRERAAVSDAVGPHGMADRAFGRDMDRVRILPPRCARRCAFVAAWRAAAPDRSAPEKSKTRRATGNRSRRRAWRRRAPMSPASAPRR